MAEERKSRNVTAMFPPHQIQEMKEAFTMIDQNRDGFIDLEDLKDMYASLGREPKDDELKAMLKEAPDKLNFTAFLTLFGEKLHGTDSEETMRNAFRMFDEDQKGFLEEEYIRELLTTMGDNFTKEEIKQTWKEAPIDGGHFDYNSFVTVIKRGKDDE